MTHFVHGEQKSLTEPYYDNLLKQVTKTKTMGAPKAPSASPVPHRIAKSARAKADKKQSLAGSEDELRRKGGSAPMLDVETFKSTIPLRWIGGCDNVASTYTVRLRLCRCL